MRLLTASGEAELSWYRERPVAPTGLMVLGHGAGGGFQAPDLMLVSEIAYGLGIAVGHVEQPYRVAGKRAPAPAARLDAAFVEVVTAARGAARNPATRAGARNPLIVGGRSSGARVACRTALTVSATGVLALAFPLQPPRPPDRPAPSRLPELLGAGVPVLVVQGERDTFGGAQRLAGELAGAVAGDQGITLTAATGADHALRKGIDVAAVSAWLSRFLR